MPKGQIRVVFMGTPAYVIPVLRALTSAEDVQVVGVYTPPDRPRGRGRPMEMPPVKDFALERELPVVQPPSLRTDRAREELAALLPDVVVVAAYGKLLPVPLINTPSHGCLNLHPSLLPRYRGPSPVATAILDGEDTTGVSLMLLDEGMDTGPIISRRELALSGHETAGILTETLFQLGAELLLEELMPWVGGRIEARPQDDTRPTVTRKLQRGDGEADWNLPATALERRCRAFTPWPGLSTRWDGRTLKLLNVAPVPQSAGPRAILGQVVPLSLPDLPVAVGTGEGLLGLKSLQLEGRRVLSSEDFLRGHPDFLKAQLGSRS